MISDGYQNHRVLDVLGKGSFIGMNFALMSEMWYYRIENNSTPTVRILKIKMSIIDDLASQYIELDNALRYHKQQLEIDGLHQIDY